MWGTPNTSLLEMHDAYSIFRRQKNKNNLAVSKPSEITFPMTRKKRGDVRELCVTNSHDGSGCGNYERYLRDKDTNLAAFAKHYSNL